VGVAGTVGVATFIGVSTATLGTPNAPGVSTSQGSFIYQWYSADGTKLTDGVNISGSGTTTLTVSNITSPDDDGKSFYLESAFSSGTYDTTTGRGVGNALNGPLKTSTAALKVLPTVIVTSEPAAVTVGTGEVATFTSSATTSDPDQGALAFQWTVDGENVTDEGRRDALVGNYASGANTTTLEIKKTTVGVSTVQFNAFVDAEGFRIAAKSKGTKTFKQKSLNLYKAGGPFVPEKEVSQKTGKTVKMEPKPQWGKPKSKNKAPDRTGLKKAISDVRASDKRLYDAGVGKKPSLVQQRKFIKGKALPLRITNFSHYSFEKRTRL